MKYATEQYATVGIVDNCDYVLAFIQAVELKAPQVMAETISLQADKQMCNWFHQWVYLQLTPHPNHTKNAPQDHSDITGVLNEVTTRLQNVEDLCPVVVGQRKVDR